MPLRASNSEVASEDISKTAILPAKGPNSQLLKRPSLTYPNLCCDQGTGRCLSDPIFKEQSLLFI